MGTRASRTALYHAGSIENGGAESVEPATGGGRVCGSLLGLSVNKEGSGREKWTVAEAIFGLKRPFVEDILEM